MIRNEQGNVARDPKFTQVCVWPATVVGEDKVDEFVKFMKETFNTRVQYLEEIKTAPDCVRGKTVKGTGGRNDLFFAVHDDDVGRFAVPRLEYGIRWIEDVFQNGGGYLYDKRVASYQCW